MYDGIRVCDVWNSDVLNALFRGFSKDKLDDIMDASFKLEQLFVGSLAPQQDWTPWGGKKDAAGLELSRSSFRLHPEGVDIQNFEQFMEFAEVAPNVVEDDGTISIVTFPPFVRDRTICLPVGNCVNKAGFTASTGSENGCDFEDVGRDGPWVIVFGIHLHKSNGIVRQGFVGGLVESVPNTSCSLPQFVDSLGSGLLRSTSSGVMDRALSKVSDFKEVSFLGTIFFVLGWSTVGFLDVATSGKSHLSLKGPETNSGGAIDIPL